MLETLRQWDRDLLIYLNNLGSETWDGFWVFVTRIETWTPLFILFALIIFYFFRKWKGVKVLLWVAITFAITLFFTDAIKVLVERIRPNNLADLSTQLRILQNAEGFSFFSGHASTSFAIATMMALFIRSFSKWIYLAYLWPFLFAASRIVVGVHFPSDILIGSLVGTLLAVGSYRLYLLTTKKSPGSPHS